MADFYNPRTARQATAHTQPASASVGDEVFFHLGGQPVAGRVICTGKHGCTVECDGQQHRVKWGKIAGYKKRAMQRYRVLDQGEDGLIVSDSSGKRRYVGIPPEARGDRLTLTGTKKNSP